MEELVNKLAELQDRIVEAEHQTDADLEAVDKEIDTIKESLTPLMEHRKTILVPHMERIKLLNEAIDATKTQLIDEWDGEKKTLKFDAGTVKFRTTQKLEIYHPEILIADMFAHLQTGSEMMKYLSGFNKTEVKKYIGVHPQDIDTVELIPTTTVKLELSG